MARQLYRFYLYFVLLAMLVFASLASAQLLEPLLALTSLRGDYGTPPSNQVLVQRVVFAVVTWLIAGAVGGVHYWLIRRDMQRDPAAGGGAIRAFFLNMTELIVAPAGIGVFAVGVLAPLGHTPANNISVAGSIAIVLLALFAFLEWERQRATAAPGAARAFERLHLYGVQLILLAMFAIAWLDLVKWLLDAVLFGGAALGVVPCGGFTACPSVNLLSSGVSVLWLLLCWIGYGYFNRHDSPSRLRQILHFGSFASGVTFLLMGTATGFDLLMKLALQVPISISEIVNPLKTPGFISLITLGLLIMGVYACWLWMSAERQPEQQATIRAVAAAILTALLAVWFWWGIGSTLLAAIESLLPAGNVPLPEDWAAALAAIISGLAYPLLAFYLRRWSMREPAVAAMPRRGFLFALLGGGTLAGAIGSAVALYALGTALLGSPLDNWVSMARTGLSAGITGACVMGISLWLALREHTFKGLIRHQEEPQPAVEQAPALTIEAVLDDLLAHRITRETAATRLHTLSAPAVEAPATAEGWPGEHAAADLVHTGPKRV